MTISIHLVVENYTLTHTHMYGNFSFACSQLVNEQQERATKKWFPIGFIIAMQTKWNAMQCNAIKKAAVAKQPRE